MISYKIIPLQLPSEEYAFLDDIKILPPLFLIAAFVYLFHANFKIDNVILLRP